MEIYRMFGLRTYRKKSLWFIGAEMCQSDCKPEESKVKPTPDDKRYLWLMFGTIKDMNQLNSMLMPAEGDERERFFGNVQPLWVKHVADKDDARLVIPWRDYQYALERLKEYGHLLPGL